MDKLSEAAHGTSPTGFAEVSTILQGKSHRAGVNH